MRFHRLKAGAAGQQYAIIVGLVGVVALVSITTVGGNIRGLFGNTANVLVDVTNASAAQPQAVPPLPANCVEDGGFTWCSGTTTIGCSDLNTGPTTLGGICTAAGRSWAGNHIQSDAAAHAVANLLRTRQGYATQSRADGCSGDGGGGNAYALDGGGICSRESQMLSASDRPCSPWSSYSGTVWRIFSRCQ